MGTRFLLTSDSPVADAVKQVYLAAGLDGTVVTTRVDGVPHPAAPRTTMVDHLERSGAGGWKPGPVGSRRGRVPRAVRAELAGDDQPGPGLASGNGAPGQRADLRSALMAPKTRRCCCARPWWTAVADLGLMSSGQVAGLIDDLPSCQELIEAIVTEAERRLDRLARRSPDGAEPRSRSRAGQRGASAAWRAASGCPDCRQPSGTAARASACVHKAAAAGSRDGPSPRGATSWVTRTRLAIWVGADRLTVPALPLVRDARGCGPPRASCSG